MTNFYLVLNTLQISIGWLYVISRYFTYRYIVCIGKIPLSAKGITDEITYNHPIDICSASDLECNLSPNFVFMLIRIIVKKLYKTESNIILS